MRTPLTAAALAIAASTAVAQTTAPPPLFVRNDAIWSAAFLAGSIALTRVDVRIARAWSDSALHADKRVQTVARDFAKIQEGTLGIGNLALYGIARLTKMRTAADVTFHAAEAVAAASAVSQVIRGPLGRSRPRMTDNSDPYDFHFLKGFTNIR